MPSLLTIEALALFGFLRSFTTLFALIRTLVGYKSRIMFFLFGFRVFYGASISLITDRIN